MIKFILEKLMRREDLTCAEARQAMELIMEGALKEAQIGAYLAALRCKGETAPEILGSCLALREGSAKIAAPRSPLLDTCGTGGDARGTFNISTVSAFVCAGAGVTVAKHGNRAVSGQCGSADLCEALGLKIDLSVAELELCLQETGLAFLYAPLLYPALAHVAPTRRALGVRTVFNLLGPLNNPAGAKRQLLGVYEAELTEKMAAVLAELGTEHALVVAGGDGLDEITITSETRVTEVKNGQLHSYTLAPEDFGLPKAPLEALKGGDAKTNSRICLAVLQGEKGPQRDIVLLNAGASLYVAGLAQSIGEGIELARSSIDSGAARAKLEALAEFSAGRRKTARPAKGEGMYA